MGRQVTRMFWKGVRNISTNHSTRSIKTANGENACGIMSQTRLILFGVKRSLAKNWIIPVSVNVNAFSFIFLSFYSILDIFLLRFVQWLNQKSYSLSFQDELMVMAWYLTFIEMDLVYSPPSKPIINCFTRVDNV